MIKNPFLQSARLRYFIKQDQLTVFDTQGSEPSSVKGHFSTQHEFEKDPFIKLYNDKSFFNVFKQTSDTASKIFLYIAYTIPKDKDSIVLNPEDVMGFVGIKSVTTYYKYIQELMDNAVIARRSNSEYWVNPHFVFNGNRIDFYKEHCPECLDAINITQIQEARTIKKKKDLMTHFQCRNYYQLKVLLGDDQIQDLLTSKKTLSDIKLLK